MYWVGLEIHYIYFGIFVLKLPWKKPKTTTTENSLLFIIRHVILINVMLYIHSIVQINYPTHSSSILKKNEELIDIESLAPI